MTCHVHTTSGIHPLMDREIREYVRDFLNSEENMDLWAKYVDIEILAAQFEALPDYLSEEREFAGKLMRYVDKHPSKEKKARIARVNICRETTAKEPFSLKDSCVLVILQNQMNYREASIPETLKNYMDYIQEPMIV